VPSSSRKHVEFASPPAVPISPASYPSSPESTRNSFVLNAPLHGSITSVDYSQALQSDPFREEAVNDENDPVIEQALRNARSNSQITPAIPPSSTREPKEDAVRDTLSRFASNPRRTNTGPEKPPDVQASKGHRHTLDVDSFKRLLLTGESGLSIQSSTSQANPTPVISDSSSTDTASVSQRSTGDSGRHTVDETPRSSYEVERSEIEAQPLPLTLPSTTQERKPPPLPRPRHGRRITDTSTTTQEALASMSTYDSPDPATFDPPSLTSRDATPRLEPEDGSTQSAAKKRPPPPPLARKKSNRSAATRPGMVRSGSSRYSLTSESDDALSPVTSDLPNKPAPPPPPSRRPNAQGGRQPSVDLPSTLEEDDINGDRASISSGKTPFVSQRISQGPTGEIPPPPPPRRNRGSNRSSMDGQRPSTTALGITSSDRNSSEYSRPSNTADTVRKVSGSSNAADIMADLAALKREVDAARKYAGQ
jgi:hypothetical protein